MSASAYYFPEVPGGPDVLSELLHSLSQPLTSLRCCLELSLERSLDLSIEEGAAQQQVNVVVALQETERVVGMIQLMREYLDAEQSEPAPFPAALEPMLRNVVEELSSIASVRGVRLLFMGTCAGGVPVPAARLRLALQYLIVRLIEAQPVGGEVTLLLGEGPAGTVLRGEGQRSIRAPAFGHRAQGVTRPQTPPEPVTAPSAASTSTFGRVKRAIAHRVLESAGASLVFGEAGAESGAFVLRVPRRVGIPA